MELVKFDNNNKLITELRTVCEVFNKNHYNVMRDVYNIINDLPSCSSEFIPQTYKDVNNRTQNTYYLTEKGFYLLTSSFKGSKARQFQSQFFDEFKRLQSENTLLLETHYIEDRTYCISDIVQKFKDLSPMDGQHLLYINNYLEWRQNGMFPSEYYDKDNTIVSVYDSKRGRYYPRYTLKGCIMVENFFKSKGYELK